MVRLAGLALAASLGCAEMRRPPTFPQGAAGQPVVHEQALLGLSEEGDAAVVQLVDAEAQEPELVLTVFDHAGGPTRPLLVAPRQTAHAVARRVREAGRRASPV